MSSGALRVGAGFVVLASGSKFVFSKSKGIFGTHTNVYELSNLSSMLTGGDRVTFRWVRD